MPERAEKPIAHTTEIKRSDFPVKRTISRTSLFSIKVLVIRRVFFLGGAQFLPTRDKNLIYRVNYPI